MLYCTKLLGRLSTASHVTELTSTPSLPKIQASAHQLLLTILYYFIPAHTHIKTCFIYQQNSEKSPHWIVTLSFLCFSQKYPKCLKYIAFFLKFFSCSFYRCPPQGEVGNRALPGLTSRRFAHLPVQYPCRAHSQ